jgi:hypothetical protein
MCVCFECYVCCQVRSLRRADHSSRGSYRVSACVCVCVSFSMIRCNSNHLFPTRHLILRHMSHFLHTILFTFVFNPATYYWKTITPNESFTNLQRRGCRFQHFNSNSCHGVDPIWEARQLDSSQKYPAVYVTPNFIDVLTINCNWTSFIPYKSLHLLYQQFILILYTDRLLSLRTGPLPLPQRFPQRVRSSASSSKCPYRPNFSVHPAASYVFFTISSYLLP